MSYASIKTQDRHLCSMPDLPQRLEMGRLLLQPSASLHPESHLSKGSGVEVTPQSCGGPEDWAWMSVSRARPTTHLAPGKEEK